MCGRPARAHHQGALFEPGLDEEEGVESSPRHHAHPGRGGEEEDEAARDEGGRKPGDEQVDGHGGQHRGAGHGQDAGGAGRAGEIVEVEEEGARQPDQEQGEIPLGRGKQRGQGDIEARALGEGPQQRRTQDQGIDEDEQNPALGREKARFGQGEPGARGRGVGGPRLLQVDRRCVGSHGFT